MKRAISLSALLFLLAVQTAWSQIPQTMSFQGVLSNASGVVVPDGNYQLTFRLYDAPTGGNLLWSESHSSVAVSKGVFNVI